MPLVLALSSMEPLDELSIFPALLSAKASAGPKTHPPTPSHRVSRDTKRSSCLTQLGAQDRAPRARPRGSL